jgi:rhamnose utilization protein RhaD (predicted bifunctional aldolase and dehydrogenase)
MDTLDTIIALSHEFGTVRYVRGGGGNTSCKTADTLWVKPSGTTLAGLTRDAMVAMDRARIAELYSIRPPESAAAREELIKDRMAAAVRPGSTGRPSVEAALHDSFDATLVVHTHPELVNGLTCARDGQAACARLFPEALWIGYVDPGYTLCVHVRAEMEAWRTRHGRQPAVVMLENHGVFIAGATAAEIRATYGQVLSTLERAYAAAGVGLELHVGPAPAHDVVEQTTQRLRATLGAEAAAFVAASGPFTVPAGPLSPDHIVHSRSFMLRGEPTPEAVESFRSRHGYAPSVIGTAAGVFAVGRSERDARLALEFALDGARVEHLAAAFGGVRYLDDRARSFIENWEVESYRRKVALRT